ncbi:tyrosine-type recombinase/integrase [Niabella aquatica]
MARAKIYLNTRFKSSDGGYYVKLRITANRVSRYYPTDHRKYAEDGKIAEDLKLDRTFTEKEFNRIYNGVEIVKKKVGDERLPVAKPIKRTNTEELYRMAFRSFESKAEDCIKRMKVFTFEGFERLFLVNREANNSLTSIYNEKIKHLKSNEQFGTAETYQNAINSINEFKLNLKLADITPELLNAYEKGMLKSDKSRTTISMYTRTLRTIFNEAIEDGLITQDHYPFRVRRSQKKKYAPPSAKNIKKALTFEQITKLYFYTSPLAAVQKAVDFWKLSYLCNGMNFSDLLSLRWKNIEGDYIVFTRKKTEETKEKSETITVHIKDDAREIIRKYSHPSINTENYIFPILNNKMDSQTAHKTAKNFICYTNKKLKQVAKDLKLPHFSTYSARHSFATTLKKNNASIELIREALGHSSATTTKNYLDSFDKETIKDATDVLIPKNKTA